MVGRVVKRTALAKHASKSWVGSGKGGNRFEYAYIHAEDATNLAEDRPSFSQMQTEVGVAAITPQSVSSRW
jgi:hypothetical protein